MSEIAERVKNIIVDKLGVEASLMIWVQTHWIL